MADEAHVLRGIHWREAFPFTHLFRAFRIAINPSKLVLGLVLLLLLYAGGKALDQLWPATHRAVPGEVGQYEAYRSGSVLGSGVFARQRETSRAAVESDYATLLLELDLTKSENEARASARDGARLGEIKSKLVEIRDARVKEAQRALAQRESNTESLKGEARDAAEAQADREYESAVRAAHAEAYAKLQRAKAIKGEGLFIALFEYEVAQVTNVVDGVLGGNWLGGWRGGAADVSLATARGVDLSDGGAAIVARMERPGVVRSVINFFTVGPIWLLRYHPVYFALFAIYFLVVWSVFGGAIARIAAVHVARDEKLSVRSALSFSVGKLLSFASAPLIPLLIVVLVGLVPLAAGILASLPFVGPVFNVLMGLLFVVLLVAGFVMALVMVGAVGGFNLMYPTIAVEGSDSFDAISRSFSYVYARPWRMLLYTTVAVIYGALCYLFVRLFLVLMLGLTHCFVGAGMWKDAPSTAPLWNTMWPGPAQRLSYDVDFLTLRWDQDLAAVLIAFWVYLAVATLGAFAISFYFSASTIMYYLLRRDVDATELDDVYLDQTDEDFGDTGASSVAAEMAGGHSAAGQLHANDDAGPAIGPSGAPASSVKGSVNAAGPQTDNPPGETLTYAAPSDAPAIRAATEDPAAEKRSDEEDSDRPANG